MRSIHLGVLCLSILASGVACDRGPDSEPRVACVGGVTFGIACDDDDDDGGDDPGGTCDYRTHTPEAWGAPCVDDGPGCFLADHFGEVFPEGLYVGCGALTATLVHGDAVAGALPTAGEPRALLATEAVAFDGEGDPQVGTRLFGQAVALALSVGFDGLPGFAPAHDVPLGALVVEDPQGPCHGLTVQAVLDEADRALGDCGATLTPAEVDGCVAAINAAFDARGECSDALVIARPGDV